MMAFAMGKRQQIPALTSLRFIAALAVVVYHYGGGYRGNGIVPLIDYPPMLKEVVYAGYAGVSFFFVLSGFVLVYSYGDWFQSDLSRVRSFLRARFARIYPLYLLTHTVGVLILVAITWPEQAQGSALIRTTATWMIGLFHAGSSPNGPAWSIGHEAMFYLCFPGFVYIVLRRCTSRLYTVVLTACIYLIEVALFVVVIATISKGDPGVLSAEAIRPTNLLAASYSTWYMRIWEFFFGCALATLVFRFGDWFQQRSRRDVLVVCCLAGIVILTVASQVVWPDEPIFVMAAWYVGFTPLFGLFIAAIAAGPTFISRPLAYPSLVLLGESSYALYLWHWLPMMPLLDVAPRQPIPFGISIGAILGTIGLSIVSYRFVETPARRWLRGSQPPALIAAPSPRRRESPRPVTQHSHAHIRTNTASAPEQYGHEGVPLPRGQVAE